MSDKQHCSLVLLTAAADQAGQINFEWPGVSDPPVH